MNNEVIFACSSGHEANVAISVIRVSGFHDLSFFKSFFSNIAPQFKPNRAYIRNLFFKNQQIDQALILFFRAPQSFNGENILEFHIHGNKLNREKMFHCLIEIGARLALPGEFTRRALANHKLTLTQAEGLDLFLNASTPLALEQGLSLLNGELYSDFLKLHQSFLSLKSSLEIALDFSEDVGEEESQKLIFLNLNHFEHLLSKLYQQTLLKGDELLRPKVVFYGIPNAGKSTLFNTFCGTERALVSPEAGTTRDYISETLFFQNIQFSFVDTAGIRDKAGAVEQKGIELSKKMITIAFCKVLVVNPFIEEPVSIEEHVDFPQAIIFTHSDLKDFDKCKSRWLSDNKLHLVLWGQPSVFSNTDFDRLSFLNFLVKRYDDFTSNKPLLLGRHRIEVQKAHSSLSNFRLLCQGETDFAILSMHLKELENNLSALLGYFLPDDVLNHVFDNFCIGK